MSMEACSDGVGVFGFWEYLEGFFVFFLGEVARAGRLNEGVGEEKTHPRQQVEGPMRRHSSEPWLGCS